MSWNKDIVVSNACSQVALRSQIFDEPVSPQPDQQKYDTGEHNRQVQVAKDAAFHLAAALKVREGKDIKVTISGHTCLDGQDWDAITASVTYVDHPKAMPEKPVEAVTP